MDEVTENVATRDDAVDRGGRAGPRTALAYALVGPTLIVVGDILSEYLPRAPLVHNEQAIQSLRAQSESSVPPSHARSAPGTGVWMISTPSLAKTVSKCAGNVVRRSWVRKRMGDAPSSACYLA